MGYNERNIKDITEDLNHVIFLPDIQREFVWSPEQVVKLFDSLMNGYPIGSFLSGKLEKRT